MIKLYTLELIAVFILAAVFCQPALAKEDTTQISLKKTAVSKQNIHLYKIKKGDVISAIIRRLPGITEDDMPDKLSNFPAKVPLLLLHPPVRKLIRLKKATVSSQLFTSN